MSRSFGVPAILCAILVGAIAAVAAVGWGFTGAKRPLPMPMAISNGQAAGGQVVFTRNFDTGADGKSASLVAAGPAGFEVRLDGRAIGQSSGGPPAVVRTALGEIARGPHELSIVSARPAEKAVVGLAMDIRLDNGSVYRVVTDDSWQVSAGGGSSSAASSIIGDRSSPDLGGAFSSLPDAYSEPKGPVFWVTFLCLIAAMVVSCFAGPILRPAHLSGAVGPAVGLAAIVPSVLYASSAFVITGIAGLGAGIAWIVGLHVVALALLLMVLAAIGATGKLAAGDQAALKAELSGYDSMLERSDLIVATVRGLPASVHGDWTTRIDAMAEKIRFSATTTSASDIDRAILAELSSLEQGLGAPDSLDVAECCRRVEKIEALLLRREAVAASARRSPT